MEDSKQDRPEGGKTTGELLQERQSDATNDETIKEVEESRSTFEPMKNDSASAISPDGAFDESGEDKDTGPM